MPKKSSATSKRSTNTAARVRRAKRVVAYLKRAYPVPKTELVYRTPMQLVAAVMLSAQCTDKHVNKVTATLFKKYKTPADFASVSPEALAEELRAIPFYRNKAKAIVATAQRLVAEHRGKVPRDPNILATFPGIAYKTAHVVIGELYEEWEGIPTDTHVRRFALRLDLSDGGSLEKISKDLEALVPKEDWRFVNNGLVLYGRHVCPARPHDCAGHPLTKIYPEANDSWPKAK